ncbi:MAG: DUF3263 domain-containing protein [Acidimicrobiales bacterium]
MDLTAGEKALVDFERGWWLEAGREPKGAAIRRCLDMSPSAYRSALERLLDSPSALAYDPLLVRRLRRRRDERRRARFVGEAPRRRRPH